MFMEQAFIRYEILKVQVEGLNKIINTLEVDDYRAALRGRPTAGRRQQPTGALGPSLSGGHVLAGRSGPDDIAAWSRLIPMVDGPLPGRHALATHTPASCSSDRRSASGAGRSQSGRGPVLMPVVGRPGELATFTLPGAMEDYLAIADRPGATSSPRRGSRAQQSEADPGRVADRRAGPRADSRLRPERSPYAAMKAAFKGQRPRSGTTRATTSTSFAGKPCHDAAMKHAVTS